jgi:hypothetical protein
MPTPFTHLETAQRLLVDPAVPADLRAALGAERGAFLLGNIAADARTGGGIKREDTHFYHYEHPLLDHPWRVMLQQHPALVPPHSVAHRAFLAGYVAHLSIDEWWSLYMLGPHFALRDWAPRSTRFFYLHILLIVMDERDLLRLEGWQHPALLTAQPHQWTPFLSDVILTDWRDFIGEQIRPGGESQTLAVFGGRINRTPAELRAILDSASILDAEMWAHIPPALLEEIETGMYAHARTQMIRYWAGE